MPELHWQGKGDAVKAAENVPLRVLKLDSSLSYGAADSQNMILQGDNLDVLKALLPYFRSAVKCVYIDPPYNTRAVFEHYVDNFPHGDWLSMMYPRLLLLRDFLADDGSIWISIDDDEAHYLKIVCDEIFGRQNFIASVIWEKKYSPQNDAKWLSDSHDFILVYANKKDIWRPNLLPRTDEMNARYKNPDNDPRGVWTSGDCSAKRLTPADIYEITTPSGRKVFPPAGTSWRFSKKKFAELVEDNRIWFGADGKGVPRIKRFLSEVQGGIVSKTILQANEVGDNQEAKKEVKEFNAEKVFATPKPERLIQRILQLATQEGDLVLDAFLGSGTTAAVAQKMNRRYIGIEIGDHAITHVVPRLCKVVDGEQGGISKAVNWQGGGGFKFYQLGEKLFNEVGAINPAIEFKDLAAHVWFTETNTAYSSQADSAFLGVHNGAAIYLLTEPLTLTRYENLPPYEGEKIIYATACRLGETFLRENKVMYKELK